MKRVLLSAVLFLAACSSPNATPENVTSIPPVTSIPTKSAARLQNERLLGAWKHTFTIADTTFEDSYELTKIVEEPAGSDKFFVIGQTEFKSEVFGSYAADLSKYLILAPHAAPITFDDAYVFTLNSSNTTASGCYYLYFHATKTLSRCYALSGVKIPALIFQSTGAKKMNLQAATVTQGNPILEKAFSELELRAR